MTDILLLLLLLPLPSLCLCLCLSLYLYLSLSLSSLLSFKYRASIFSVNFSSWHPPVPPGNGSYQCQQNGSNERDARDVSLYRDGLLYPFHAFPYLYIIS